MQDIVPRKSIRDIDKNAITRGVTPRVAPVLQHQKEKKVDSFTPPKSQGPSNVEYKHGFIQEYKENHFWKYIFIILALVLVCVISYLQYQKRVTVYVTPYTASVVLNNAPLIISHEDTRVIEQRKEVEIPIVSSGTKTVEKKAQGTVIIYNKNSQSQILVAGTRVQANDGKIFTLNTRVNVPPARGVTPGSVQVAVTAQNAGVEYNSGPTDFTVPGLRGSPRFTQVYGRSTQQFQGGSREEIPVYDNAVVNSAIERVIREAKSELEEKIKKEINQREQVLGVIIWSTTQNINQSKAVVTIEGRQRVVQIDSLATQIAQEENVQTVSAGATTNDMQKLRLTVESSSASTTKILLSGEVGLKGIIDHEELKKVLTNKPFDTFNATVKSVNGIKEARFSSRPFWIGTFPEENKIVIIEN